MVRRWFYGLSIALLLATGLGALWWPPSFWILVAFAPVLAVGLQDALQRRSTIRRNFPVVGRFRYLLERFRPEIQQYFIESNTDAKPIEREIRSLVYQRAKGQLETQPFGTQRDVYQQGYEWAAHSLHAVPILEEEPRVLIGGGEARLPYSASLLNVGAMSFGALSPTAVRALAGGSARGGFALNTGEGGVSPHHLSGAGDLIWQIGTGYFGCRAPDGSFDPARFRDTASIEQVRMIELKISQGAKPGHGGVLPGRKVTPEIAAARGVPAYTTVDSPPWHSAFSGSVGLLEFVGRLRELSGGKPVGFKLSIGHRAEFLSVCRAILDTGIAPDFITVDGGEGGTGAAPLEFANSMGMPAREAWVFVHNALVGTGLRERIRILASSRIFTGFHMIRAMALGADACYSARGMMLSLGCIQALRCNNDSCPTGVATQNPALFAGLDVPDKTERVFRYHGATLRSFMELMSAMGVPSPAEIRPDLIFRRIGDTRVRSYAEIYRFLRPRELLESDHLPSPWRQEWLASAPPRREVLAGVTISPMTG
jgi:glutamate synthase domain-containing protein 2